MHYLTKNNLKDSIHAQIEEVLNLQFPNDSIIEQGTYKCEKPHV